MEHLFFLIPFNRWRIKGNFLWWCKSQYDKKNFCLLILFCKHAIRKGFLSPHKRSPFMQTSMASMHKAVSNLWDLSASVPYSCVYARATRVCVIVQFLRTASKPYASSVKWVSLFPAPANNITFLARQALLRPVSHVCPWENSLTPEWAFLVISSYLFYWVFVRVPGIEGLNDAKSNKMHMGQYETRVLGSNKLEFCSLDRIFLSVTAG